MRRIVDSRSVNFESCNHATRLALARFRRRGATTIMIREVLIVTEPYENLYTLPNSI